MATDLVMNMEIDGDGTFIAWFILKKTPYKSIQRDKIMVRSMIVISHHEKSINTAGLYNPRNNHHGGSRQLLKMGVGASVPLIGMMLLWWLICSLDSTVVTKQYLSLSILSRNLMFHHVSIQHISEIFRNDVRTQKVLPRCTQSESLVYVLGHYYFQSTNSLAHGPLRTADFASSEMDRTVRLIAFIFGWGLHCGKHTLIATGLAQSFLPPRNAAISKLEVLSLSFVSVFAPDRHQTCLELTSVVSHRILVRNGAFWGSGFGRILLPQLSAWRSSTGPVKPTT